MRDADDVREYIHGEVKKVHVRLLLEWLARIRGSQAQRPAVTEVRRSVCFLRPPRSRLVVTVTLPTAT